MDGLERFGCFKGFVCRYVATERKQVMFSREIIEVIEVIDNFYLSFFDDSSGNCYTVSTESRHLLFLLFLRKYSTVFRESANFSNISSKNALLFKNLEKLTSVVLCTNASVDTFISRMERRMSRLQNYKDREFSWQT